MKKICCIFLCILAVIALITGCSDYNTKEQRDLVRDFTTVFFTSPENNADIFKDYITEKTYDYFSVNKVAETRIPDSDVKGSMEDIKIKDLKIKYSSSTTQSHHDFNVSFTLENSKTHHEEEVSFKLVLNKEDKVWKVSPYNDFDELTKALLKMWDQKQLSYNKGTRVEAGNTLVKPAPLPSPDHAIKVTPLK